MKKIILFTICCVCFITTSFRQAKQEGESVPLFSVDLSNADYNKSVWSIDKDGVITASEDDAIWTTVEYENFEITLDFKNDNCSNSGVIIYCSDKQNWVPNSVEVQIADDSCPRFASWHPTWRNGAIFGHLAPSSPPDLLKKPGVWNTMKIIAKGKNIVVELNGVKITDMEMNLWTSGTVNPDGSEIPKWMPTPFAELPTKGYIGFQGKHGSATIWFRNIKIKQL